MGKKKERKKERKKTVRHAVIGVRYYKCCLSFLLLAVPKNVE